MADKRTRSEHFLWEQQRLREQSDRKHAASIRNDREAVYNRRDAAARRQRPQRSNQEIEAHADFVLSFVPVVWFLIKWLLAFMVWNIIVSILGGVSSPVGIVFTVIFLGLTVLKQVRRRRKRRAF
ncbi:hypothetical protein [Pseudarthrobacter sp. C4D7]|uniref:hypothetical protein n=1 Tax=Pseudarthrobacter sp. C4D7 TaxID=2735268 RepID=UPI00158541C7|nr:hypothetical protein [Pseudarthrobacter sp. C4D7]NUT70925.1 hypothetical protein [Pseudarthrobacter sp. C4D7]